MTDKVIYNPEGEAETHTFANAYDLLAHVPGWSQVPPKADKPDVVTSEDDDEGVDNEGESQEGDSSEDTEDAKEDSVPDFEAWTKNQLEDYARQHYAVELDKRKSQATLAADVIKLYREHTSE